MEELTLAIGRQREAGRLRDVPVHVPLDVRDRSARQDLGDRREEVVDNLGPREVEDELLAALRTRPAGNPDGPVRVRLEELALRADHLRFDPQPEPHPKRLDPAGKAVEAVG